MGYDTSHRKGISVVMAPEAGAAHGPARERCQASNRYLGCMRVPRTQVVCGDTRTAPNLQHGAGLARVAAWQHEVQRKRLPAGDPYVVQPNPAAELRHVSQSQGLVCQCLRSR